MWTLLCGACSAYLKSKCDGCKKNRKADKWCRVKLCVRDNGYKSCAECKAYKNVQECKKFNNIFSKIFALIFGSNRKWCINRIREVGYQSFAKEMALSKNYNGKGKK
jgi:hypothetical protein